MTLSFRRKLFVFFVILFILTGIVFIYYSQGYRINFDNFSIQKTGAIYIETYPKNVEIFLNGVNYKDKSGIITSGTLISNVIPKRYRLLIKKDGYYDYEKNIEVFESEVERFLNIRLIPTKIEPKSVIENVSGDSIVDVSLDGKVLTYDSKANTYYLFDPNQPTNTQVNLSSKIKPILRQPLNQLLFYPQSDSSFIAKTSKGIFRIDINTKTISSIKDSPLIIAKKEKNTLYMLFEETLSSSQSSKKSLTSTKVQIFDLILNRETSNFPLPIETSSIKDFDFGDNIIAVLLKNGALWLYDLEGKPIAQIGHSVNQIKFSDDKTKLMYQDFDGKIFVYLTKDELVALNLKKDQNLRLEIINPQNIQKIWWFQDSFHLIFQYPDKIALAEVTTSHPNNHFNIAITKGDAYYDNYSKTLYVLLEKTLKLFDIKSL
jgi:hypothetical protein